jgi:hypothetical protein
MAFGWTVGETTENLESAASLSFEGSSGEEEGPRAPDIVQNIRYRTFG